MKKKVLLSSIATIALCLCLIAGATFALFTSSSKVNVAITAGQVKVFATVENIVKGSTLGDGNMLNETSVEFSTDTNEIVLDKIVPGDYVNFDIVISNESDVAIQYKTIIKKIVDTGLWNGLEVSIDGVVYNGETKASDWAALAPGSADITVPVSISFPYTRGNEYQAKTCTISYNVEAVQANGTELTVTPEDAQTAIACAAPGSTVTLATGTYDSVISINGLRDVTIDANGNDVKFVFAGEIDNVVVKNVITTTAAQSINLKNATGNITIADSSFISATGKHTGAAIALGANIDVVVDNCVFEGNFDVSTNTGAEYGISIAGGSGALTITNTEFNNFKSWAIFVNGSTSGDVVVDGCTFNTPDGVFKTLGGGIQGNFTFTNNVLNGCYGHDGWKTGTLNINNLVVSSGSSGAPVKCTGTKTVSNNVLDGNNIDSVI